MTGGRGDFRGPDAKRERKLAASSGRAWCAKRRYPTADIAAKVVEKLRAKGRDEARAYQCPNCGGWHTTSRA